jgi:hypothetical protein
MTTAASISSADESSLKSISIDNIPLFEAVVAVEIAATRDASWQRAFTRAQAELMSNAAVTFDGHRLHAPSSRNPLRVYAATTISCHCDGRAYGRACWHMAAARILQRYYDAAACAAGRV